jgi:hypothetical protein
MALWPFLAKKKDRTAVKKRESEKDEITVTRHMAGGLSASKAREIFEVIQTREIVPHLPDDFADKMVSHFLFTGSPLTYAFRDKGAGKILVGYIGRTQIRKSSNDMELCFRAAPDRLPLKEWCCRWALVSAPTVPITPICLLIRDLGRIIEPGGGAAIIDWHPYSSAARSAFGSRSTADESEGIGFEKYFRAFKDAGFIATEVKEAFVDGSISKLMETREDKEWYTRHRYEPFAIVLFVKKT